MPLALKAMAAASRTQTPALYTASRPYAENAGPMAGLYYIGAARANAELSEAFAELGWKAAGTTPAVRAIDPELEALDRAAATAHGSARADRRTLFIPVNAALKIAGEASRAGFHDGALWKYLEATLALGVAAPPAQLQPPDALASALDALEATLKASRQDHSIGLAFAEMAHDALPRARDGSSDDHARVAAIVDRVLPSYFTIMEIVR
jgi:hypothetical protein